METKLKNDQTITVEMLSAVCLFGLGMFITKVHTLYPTNVHQYFWSVSLIIVAVLQMVSIKTNMIVVRTCMAWITGIIWTWISFTTLNTSIEVLALCIGSFNMYAFILLTGRISFDWSEFFKD